jgi:putative PEP-CTERM system TPR-repeat lipoprotein
MKDIAMTIRARSNALSRLALALACLTFTALPLGAEAATERSMEYLSDAGKRLEQGDVNAAVIQLKNALQQDPENYAARLLLGEIYVRQGAFADAEKELRLAVEGSPTDQGRILLSQALLGLNRYQEALDGLAVEPGDPELRLAANLIKGQALIGLGRLDEAEAVAMQILRGEALQPEANLMAARIAALEGDQGEAARRAEMALQARPGWLDAQLMKTQLLVQAGSLQEALAAADQAIESNPAALAPALVKTEILTNLGRYDEAGKTLQTVLETTPDNPQALYLQASLAAHRSDFAEADRLLRQVGDRLRDYPPSLWLGGLVKLELGQTAQAEQQLARYIALVPTNRVARRMVAQLRLRGDNPQGAINILQPVAGPTSQDVPGLQLLSSAQLQAGDLDATRATLARLVALGHAPYAQQAQSILDVIGREGGELTPEQRGVAFTLDALRRADLDLALEHAQALVAEHPEDPGILNLLGGVHLLRAENEEARDLFERALEIAPGDSSTLANLNRLDIREGHTAAVEERLRARIEQNPEDDQPVIDLARMLVSDGRTEEAESLLAERLASLPRSVTLRTALAELYGRRGDQTGQARMADELANLAREDVAGAAGAAGSLFLALEQPERAIDLLGETGATEPRTGLILARAQFVAGRADDARATLASLRETSPELAIVNNSLVDLDLRAGQAEAALELAREVEQADPVQGAMLRATVLTRTDRAPEAIEVLDAALTTTSSPALARELFRVRWQVGQQDAAIDGLRAWLAGHPEDAAAYVTLSQAYIAREESGTALALLEQANQLVPNDPQVLNNLAWLRNELGRPGADGLARQAHALAPDAAEITDTLGWILVQRGELEEGLPLLREADQALADNPDVRYHLAYALEASGEHDEARRLLEELLAGNQQFASKQEADRLLEKLKGS